MKKPLMTKVSMRHMNEIVRERNQYSRDAMEAWQDFINLKGRMDTELSKVTKRNNFLVEELESWKQQFLRFQAFAEQLTKETQELKIKIDNHKRENRRLANVIDQHKDDTARLTVQLSGTEKQRDDALEALVLQQEIAEEFERDRQRTLKELSALRHTRSTIARQRDEARRVVLHLRALIDGQAHHMDHIVKSLGQTPELSEYLEEGFEDILEDVDEDENIENGEMTSEKNRMANVPVRSGSVLESLQERVESRASSVDGKHLDGEDVTPDMESRLLSNPVSRKRLSNISMVDVADRHLRDKTDAIAYIIRNISEQCAAAVEGLDLARRADSEENSSGNTSPNSKNAHFASSDYGSENGQENQSSNGSQRQGSHSQISSHQLHPDDARSTSIPPTPDLVHNRSSTSMSMTSSSTRPERNSLPPAPEGEEIDVPTKIVEHEDEGPEADRYQGNHRRDVDVEGDDDTAATVAAAAAGPGSGLGVAGPTPQIGKGKANLLTTSAAKVTPVAKKDVVMPRAGQA